MQPGANADALGQALTVTQLSQRIRRALEHGLNEVWVVGEISNLRTPPSGHVYFCLKDQRSQVAAVMFRSARQVLTFRPEDGMQVIVRGRVDVYEARGDLQLCVDAIEPRGVGAQQIAFEQLKRRLAAEGLFAEQRKRALPFLPGAVGIVTALGGAAIHDIITTVHGRLPAMRIIIRPVRVQGQAAAPAIAQAIQELNRVRVIDVIIVGRGGGSVEDLWAFNDERVARAIVASRVPIVSAVGHEIDTTLADLAADRRAATPTAAGALVTPARDELHAAIAQHLGLLHHHVRRVVQTQQHRVALQARHLRDPRQVVRALQMRVDDLSERSLRALSARLRFTRQQCRGAAERLHALSPLAVLQRGYAIARHANTGVVVRDAHELQVGEHLQLTFSRGTARVAVHETPVPRGRDKD